MNKPSERSISWPFQRCCSTSTRRSCSWNLLAPATSPIRSTSCSESHRSVNSRARSCGLCGADVPLSPFIACLSLLAVRIIRPAQAVAAIALGLVQRTIRAGITLAPACLRGQQAGADADQAHMRRAIAALEHAMHRTYDELRRGLDEIED